MRVQQPPHPIYLQNSLFKQPYTLNQPQRIKNVPVVTFNKVPISLAKQLRTSRVKISQQGSFSVKQMFKSAIKLFVCKICYNNVQLRDTGIIGPCGHTFCTSCLLQYCIYKIQVNQDVICPQECCEVKLTSDFYFFQLLPQNIKNKFREHQIWKLTINNPNIKLCPNQNCNGGVVDLLKNPPQCNKCQRKYCKQCMMAAHKGSCDANFQKYFSNFKRCPDCKIFIQKNQGCNHMTCRCGYQFCYLCCAKWASGHICNRTRQVVNMARLQMPKWKAIILYIGHLLFYILFIIGVLAIFILGLVIGPVAGIIALPLFIAFALIPYLKIQTHTAVLSSIIWLPLSMIAGVFVAPAVFITQGLFPYAQRYSTNICNSMNQLEQRIFRQ